LVFDVVEALYAFAASAAAVELSPVKGYGASIDVLLLLQMNVSALESELSRAMAQKADTSGALSEAVAAKVAAEQRLNSILVSRLSCSGAESESSHWEDCPCCTGIGVRRWCL
jgi:hypothetical protein